MLEMDNIVTGQWKFKDSVDFNELVEIAESWSPNPNYIHLYVRRCSKDQFGIGFSCKYSGDKKEFDALFDQVSDTLKKRFGNELVGWDISPKSKVIKGF